MGDHLDTILVTPVDDDPRLGVSDLYAFPSASDPDRTVLILCVAWDAPATSKGFHPDAVYQIGVDTDGDALNDLAYNVTFSHLEGDKQVGTVRRATGQDARSNEARGDVVLDAAAVSFETEPAVTESAGHRFFAGPRSDPFFADLEGFQNDFQFTGTDFFAGKDVLGIVLEVPTSHLGSGPLGLWARSTVRHDGQTIQVDRTGSPGINITFNQGEDMAAFNILEPAQDREHFLDKFVGTLSQGMGYPEEEARGIAGQILPDVLHYDPSQPVGFPNGRRLEDDPVDAGVALVTRGQITGDQAGPHSDYLDEFPYLGPPNKTN
jgi:hypothetical protein